MKDYNYLQKMKNEDFVREEDRELMREGEYIIPPPTPEQVLAQKKKVDDLMAELELGKTYMWDADTMKSIQDDLTMEEKTLALMQNGKETYKYLDKPFTMYDAAKFYLQRCFKKDKKFITIARRDYDIVEDLFYDAIGKEKPKK